MVHDLSDRVRDHMHSGEWESAIALLLEARRADPDNPHILGRLGYCYWRQHRYGDAIVVYEHLAHVEPESELWPYFVGHQYYDQQEYAQAVAWFDKALAHKPDAIPVLYRKGHALVALERRGDALLAFQQCREAYQRLLEPTEREREQPRYADATYQQGKLLLEAGYLQMARDRLVEAAALEPASADALYALGRCHLESGHPTEAIDALLAADRATEQPRDYIRDRLAQAYAAAGNRAEALRIYEELPPALQNKSYILRHMGELYAAASDWPAAQRTMTDAVRRDPRDYEGHYLLGQIYQASGEWKLAYTQFRRAVQLRQQQYDKEFPAAQEALTALAAAHPELTERGDPRARGDARGGDRRPRGPGAARQGEGSDRRSAARPAAGGERGRPQGDRRGPGDRPRGDAGGRSAGRSQSDPGRPHRDAAAAPQRGEAAARPTGPRQVARVQKYFAEKGFGFLDTGNDTSLFFHIKEVHGADAVAVGDWLEYSLGAGKKGPEAVNLRPGRSHGGPEQA